MSNRREAIQQMREAEHAQQRREAAERMTGVKFTDQADWREEFLEVLRTATPRALPQSASTTKAYWKNDAGEPITRDNVICQSQHIDAVERFLRGESIILCDDYREGKTMAAKMAYNILMHGGESPGWITEATLFRKLRAGEAWSPRTWQIIDNAFSNDNWAGYDSRSDEATELRLRYRDDVVDRIRNSRGAYRILLTCAQAPGKVQHLQEDLRLRWLEIAEVVECRAV